MAEQDTFDTSPHRSVGAWQQLRAIADIRALVEPIPGKLMLPELVEAVRRIIAERDAARELLKRAPQLYLDGQNLERERANGDDDEADECEARALGLIDEIRIHLNGGTHD